MAPPAYPLRPPVLNRNGGSLPPAEEDGNWRKLNNWFRLDLGAPALDARRYGLKADGVTNDRAAFQRAVDAAILAKGEVRLPPGDILVEGGEVLAPAVVAIRGEGDATRIVNGNPALPAIRCGEQPARVDGYRLRDFRVALKAGVSPLTGNCGLRLKRVGQSRVESVTVEGGQAGLELSDLWDSDVQGVTVKGTVASCVILSDSQRVRLARSRAEANGTHGFRFLNCQGVEAWGLRAKGNGGFGFLIEAGTNPNRGFSFHACVAEGTADRGWSVTDLAQASFHGCRALGQASQSTFPLAAGFFFSGPTVREVALLGCEALGNNSHGVEVLGAPARLELHGCRLGSDVFAGQGNGRAGTGFGLFVPSSAGPVLVLGGSAFGNASGAVGGGGAPVIQHLLGYP